MEYLLVALLIRGPAVPAPHAYYLTPIVPTKIRRPSWAALELGLHRLAGGYIAYVQREPVLRFVPHPALAWFVLRRLIPGGTGSGRRMPGARHGGLEFESPGLHIVDASQ